MFYALYKRHSSQSSLFRVVESGDLFGSTFAVRGRFRRRCGGRFASAHVMVCQQRFVASGWPGHRRLPVFALPVSSSRSGSWCVPKQEVHAADQQVIHLFLIQRLENLIYIHSGQGSSAIRSDRIAAGPGCSLAESPAHSTLKLNLETPVARTRCKRRAFLSNVLRLVFDTVAVRRKTSATRA